MKKFKKKLKKCIAPLKRWSTNFSHVNLLNRHRVVCFLRDHKEQRMTTWNFSLPWYHGSQQELTTLRTSSSITQNRDIARVFAHCPGITALEEDGTIKHNGTTPGYLHIVDEPLTAADVEPYPHPINASKWEWLIKRTVKVRLIECPALREEEQLTEANIAARWRRQQALGIESPILETFRDDK